MAKRIVLADPRGFCAGVDRAILTVQTILKAASARVDGLPPVYVRRQIVHNRHVVEDLAAQGAPGAGAQVAAQEGGQGGTLAKPAGRIHLSDPLHRFRCCCRPAEHRLIRA